MHDFCELKFEIRMTMKLRHIIFTLILSLPINTTFLYSINTQYYIENPDTLEVIDSLSIDLEADSLQESFPAHEIYNYIWTSVRMNPYKVSIDSMPDSVLIDCREFHYPTMSNRVTSPFGMRGWRYHYGIDLGIQYRDTIYAAFSGKIRIVDYESRGYGHYVVIRHDNYLETVYAHMTRVFVKTNDIVKAGDPIGLGGSTGRSTGPHLHFETRFLGNAFNPTKLINFETKTINSNDSCYLLTKAGTYTHVKELNSLSQAAYHKVRQGDTLSHIAKKYHTTVKQLCRLNKIKETSILRIGQRIRYR